MPRIDPESWRPTTETTRFDVAAENEAREEALRRYGTAAACTPDCRLMMGYSVQRIADVVWHGTPRMKAETHLERVKKEGPDGTDERVVAWIRLLHAAERALFGDD